MACQILLTQVSLGFHDPAHPFDASVSVDH
jgi:hypothetical protein